MCGKSVLKWNRKSEAKKSILLHQLTREKLHWKGLFTLEKLNELFDFSLCLCNGRKFSCQTWILPEKTLSFSFSFSREKNQLVSCTIKKTLAVWTSLSCGMCRSNKQWKQEIFLKEVKIYSIWLTEMLFNFWSIFSIAKRKILLARSSI